jgi:release factor glutamine methyltransferase
MRAESGAVQDTLTEERAASEERAAPEERAASGPDDSERRRVTAAIADRIGSPREARWIVEVGGIEAAPALADRRAAGEPLQYVLGRWPFRSLELQVDPRVLIPRPETEQVAEVALGELARVLADPDRPAGTPGLAVDLGTGSGAIALSLATEGAVGAPLEVWATDASADALCVARSNLAALARTDPGAASRVQTAEGWWFDALPPALRGRVDLVVSNPPYVAESEIGGLDEVVRAWEPHTALVSARGACGVGGMADIETIVAGAPRWLTPSGALVVEIAPAQAYAAIDAARRAGFSQVTTAYDLAGRLRMLVARR